MLGRYLGCALATVLTILAPAAAGAQVFLSTRPNPEFTIGPLFVRASVTPALAPVTVDILWSLAIPPGLSATNVEQDLFLLWPGEVAGDPAAGKGDPALAGYVEARGFTVIDDGRLTLSAQTLYRGAGDGRETFPGGAPYVTFVRVRGALGLTAPVTYVRIPWTPALADRTRLIRLRFTAKGVIKPRRTTWVEEIFWGPRHIASLSFNDVRARALFPMYFEHRDRIVRLAEEPSQILLNFTDADHLKIDQVSPPSASRKLSETMESTEVVSLFLDRSEGITPQLLTVEFGYFSGLRSWAPVLIPMVFFILGNLATPMLRSVAERVGRLVTARFQFVRPRATPEGRDRGVVLPRQVLAKIVPGETTYDEVIRLGGPEVEEHEQLASPERRTLVYRGSRVVPHRRPIFGWLARVTRWEIERHEVEIQLEQNVVRDVHARVRRAHTTEPEEA